MRVWLALVFGLVVAATAAATAAVFLGRFDDAFEARAGELAVGYSVDVAIRAGTAGDEEAVDRIAESVSSDLPLAVFLFDPGGELLTPPRSRTVAFDEIPRHEEALAAALAGERFVETADDGSGTLVGLRVREGPAAALVAYASHPELEDAVGLARSKITEAALWGVLVGGLAGVLVAALIARRLRRIAAGAAAIEQGDFERTVDDRFPDEVGALAASIDRMRLTLRQSFADLASERDRLTRLLERLHEGVVTVREDGSVDFANDAAHALFGGSALREGSPVPEPWDGASLRDLAASLFEPGARVAYARAEADEQTISIAGIPAAGSDTVILVFEDVSEQERRERAEREFVSNAAHELRTPLQTILGAVEALKGGAKDDPDDLPRFLGHIEREGMRLARLTRALLVLARAQTREEPVALAPVDLCALLGELAARSRVHEGVRITVACPPGLAALAEPNLLEQAVGNLLANALQHTESGSVTLTARETAGGVEIEVADTGPGIPVEARARVFDRFYRAGARGADGFGLGLAIARESVRALGGDVVVEDAQDGGTRAVVVLRAPVREPV
jgi:signal transduction histidine kinase